MLGSGFDRPLRWGEMLKTVVIGIAALILFYLGPWSFLWLHSKKQERYCGQSKREENNRFLMPETLWLLTLPGFLVSLCLCVISYLLIFILLSQISHPYWPVVMVFFLIYWLSMTLFLPAIVFEEHKDDFVYFREHDLQCRIKGETFEVCYKCLQEVTEARRKIILHTVGKKTYCLPNDNAFRFKGASLLLRRLREVLEK